MIGGGGQDFHHSEQQHRRSDSSSLLTARHTPHPSYDASLEVDGSATVVDPSFLNHNNDNNLTNNIIEEETQSIMTDTSGENKAKRATLNIMQLATIIFYSVSGGPFGIEESVRAAGPFYTLVGFAIAPFVFSLPECLMTVELSAGGFKSSAAGAAWVEEAFGSRAGFMAGFLRCVV